MRHRLFRLFVLATLSLLFAFSPQAQTARDTAQTPELTITIGAETVRFVPRRAVQEIRLQVFQQSGELLLDTGARPTPEFEWNLRDANDQPLAPGLYTYTFSLRSAEATEPSRHSGNFIIERSQEQFWLTTKDKTELGAEVTGSELTASRTESRTTVGTHRSTDSRTTTGGEQNNAQDATNKPSANVTTEAAGVGTPGKIAKWVTADTLTDSILTQGNGFVAIDGHFALKGNMLKLRNNGDINTIIQYNSEVNGPGFYASGGFRWANGVNGATERMRLTSDGFLGIGMRNPDRPLTVQGTGNAGEWLSLKDTVGLTRWHFNNLGGGLNLAQSGVRDGRLFLSPNGQVGIGTITPQTTLDVAGTLNAATQYNLNNERILTINGPSALPNSNLYLGAQIGNLSGGQANTFIGYGARVSSNTISRATAIGAYATVDRSNRIVLGTVEDEVYLPNILYVRNLPPGDFRNVQWDAATGLFRQDNSSQRYKENIRPLTVDFLRLLAAEPKTYTRPGTPNRWEIGFIAEEMHALGLTELVEYDQEGRPDGVRYDKISLYLTRLAADQQTLIQRLQMQLQEQQSRLDGLHKLVCQQNPQAEVCQPEREEVGRRATSTRSVATSR